jgi:uncharacterized membrane protein YkvA (DUF1232 family)
MGRLKEFVRRFKREVSIYRAVAVDRRVPLLARIMLGAAIAYLFMPFDLIPDWIPVLGLLDDVIVVPGLIWLALLLVPKGIVAEHRGRVRSQEEAR